MEFQKKKRKNNRKETFKVVKLKEQVYSFKRNIQFLYPFNLTDFSFLKQEIKSLVAMPSKQNSPCLSAGKGKISLPKVFRAYL